MGRRVGRPIKPFDFNINYSVSELLIMLKGLRKLKCDDALIRKVKYNISEKRRLTKAYEKAKERLFKESTT